MDRWLPDKSKTEGGRWGGGIGSGASKLWSSTGLCCWANYMNDLPAGIESTVQLFADDTIIYNTADNQAILQSNIKRLEKCEADCYLEFHPHECSHSTFTRKHIPSTPMKYRRHRPISWCHSGPQNQLSWPCCKPSCQGEYTCPVYRDAEPSLQTASTSQGPGIPLWKREKKGLEGNQRSTTRTFSHGV